MKSDNIIESMRDELFKITSYKLASVNGNTLVIEGASVVTSNGNEGLIERIAVNCEHIYGQKQEKQMDNELRKEEATRSIEALANNTRDEATAAARSVSRIFNRLNNNGSCGIDKEAKVCNDIESSLKTTEVTLSIANRTLGLISEKLFGTV